MPDDTVKIHAFLAQAGVASRRKAEVLVQEGKVWVNGEKALVGQRINPDLDTVKVEGKLIKHATNHTYILIDKPAGIVSTTSDELERSTVIDLVPPAYQKVRLYPVGRLDQESEGLILLTNDGDVAYRLTHPKFNVPKTYEVILDREPTDEAISHLERGVKLDGEYHTPISVELDLNDPLKLTVVVHEGQKHLVRRMMQRIGYTVDKLVRTTIGPLNLNQVPQKGYYLLNNEEATQLQEYVRLLK